MKQKQFQKNILMFCLFKMIILSSSDVLRASDSFCSLAFQLSLGISAPVVLNDAIRNGCGLHTTQAPQYHARCSFATRGTISTFEI